MSDKITIFSGDINKNVSFFEKKSTLLDTLYNGIGSFFASVRKFIDKIFDRNTTLPNINTSGTYDKYSNMLIDNTKNVLPKTKSSGIYDKCNKISELILRHPILAIICSCAFVWLLTGYCSGRKRRDFGSSNANSGAAKSNKANPKT